MSKTPKHKLEAEPATLDEPTQVTNIDFIDPVSAADLKIVAHEDREVVSEAQMSQLRAAADNDDLKRDFTLQVLAARQLAQDSDKPPPPQPIAPRIQEQTNAEMAAGRAAVAKADEHYSRHGRPQAPDQPEGTVAVFRPDDYVPDIKKGQGILSTQSINK